MNVKLRKEINKLIEFYNLNCFIGEFRNNADWEDISSKQKLSEKFIEEFKDKVDWHYISAYQNLSENFMREFQNKVYWNYTSGSQKLSEDFIKEFQNKVNWEVVSGYQTLSEKFIEEFKDKVNIKLYNEIHKKKTKRQKLKEIKLYAKKHNLKYDKKYLYAYREHDNLGRGIFNKTIFYKKGKYYKDWKCDMREKNKNSFGLGIFSEGNTKVKVKIEDWGVEVENGMEGKARVWGFEIV